MGLTDEDVRDLTLGWNATMTAVQKAILAANGYTWSLMKGQENANAEPTLLNRTLCTSQLRAACQPSSFFQTEANLFGLTFNQSTLALLQLQQDIAFFLLARGPYSWLGWGTWGMTWPFNPEPAHGELPPLPHGVPRPPELDKDYGHPLEICHEQFSSDGSGVFVREWSKVRVTLDCNSFEAWIVEK